MLNVEIEDTQLQDAISAMIAHVFKPDNYNNPLKGLVEKMCGSSYNRGTMTDQIEAKITAKLTAFMETNEFDAMLGQAVAKAIAEREIKKRDK
jgi:hypothetical protein